jgi:hypothetical protein
MAYARSITYAVLFIWVSVTLSVAQQQATASTSKPEDQVTQLERDWLTADGKGNAASLRRIIADDFIGSSFDSGLLSRKTSFRKEEDRAGSPVPPQAIPMCESLAIPQS